MTKYCLGICELFHKRIHGFDESSSKNIKSHYIVNNTIEVDDFYNNEYKNELDFIKNEFNYNYESFVFNHSIIRNYNAIIRKDNYYKLDIIELKELEGGEQIGIIKTFWLKLVQRRWKSIYKKRQALIRQMSNPIALMNRQLGSKNKIIHW